MQPEAEAAELARVTGQGGGVAGHVDQHGGLQVGQDPDRPGSQSGAWGVGDECLRARTQMRQPLLDRALNQLGVGVSA